MRLLRCALLLVVFCVSVHAQCSSSPPGVGYYCSSNQVVQCPVGQYCASAGLTAPTNACTAGYFCAPGSVNAYGANYSAGVTRVFADASTTLSDGSGSLSLPTSTLFDSANNILYVVDNLRILRFGPGTTGSNLAGQTTSGSADGTGTNAAFSGCSGLAASPSFTYLYTADSWSNVIRQINVATRAVTTVAGSVGSQGSTDGIGNAAQFYKPVDVAINSAGTYLYVVDQFNNRIRRIQISNFQVTTIAGSTASNSEPDGVGTNALFFQPYGVTMYPNGLFLLVLSRGVRRIELSTGVVTTLTKSGAFQSNPGNFYSASAYATSASIDPTGSFAYLIMQYPDSSSYSQIRQLNLNTGVFRSIGTSFTKNGFSTPPSGLSIDSTGSSLFASDSNQHNILHVSLNNQCSAGYYCLAGATAPVVCPLGSYCPLGSASATTCATAGSYCPAGSSAQRPCPGGSYCSSVSTIVQCPAGTYCTAGSTAASNQLACTSIGAYCAAGSSTQGTCPKGSYCPNTATQNFCPKGMFCASVGYTAPSGNCSAGYLCDSGSINSYGASPNASVVSSEFVRSFVDNTGSSFSQPQGIAAARQFVYVADTTNNVIRFVELATGNVRTLAGNPSSGNVDGTGTAARFYGPTGLVIDSTGQTLYVADSFNHRIRQIQNNTGVVTTIAGSGIGLNDGLGTYASFRNPRALALDSNYPYLYVADTDNNCIRKVDMTNNNNQVTTLAGNALNGYLDSFGTNALFDTPTAIAVDPTGNYLVVGDSNNKYVRRVEISTGIVTTMTLSSAFANNPSNPASFFKFTGLTFDMSGSFLFVAEESMITQIAFGSSVSAAKQFGRNNHISAISLDPYSGVNLYASDNVQNKLFQFTPSSPCPSGYSCAQGVAAPTLCAIGSYCPAGTSTPSSCTAVGSACCPAGQFLSSGSCQSCSFDTFTSGANTLPYCSSCPAGTRSISPTGSTACKASSASRHVLSFGVAMIALLFTSLI